MTETSNLLVDAGTIIVPLMVAGAILKHAFPKFPNRLIPLITWVLGIGAYVVKTGGHTMNDWVTASLIAATATGVHSGIKNFTKKGPVAVAILAGFLSIASLTGCKSPGLTQSMVRTAVSTSVGFGVIKHPEAVPYLRATTSVFCSAASGTNISPAEIVAALEKSPAGPLRTPESVIILNGILGIYSAIYETYGDSVKDRPFLQASLEGVCEGIPLGLPPVPTATSILEKKVKSPFESKPHVK